MLNAIFFILIGFVLLIGGAEYLVKGAVAIANKLNIPAVIVGLTIVAFGTSTPEFVVSIKAAFSGAAGISVGNVVGSNIANILLILGVTSIIYPVVCNRKEFLRDYKFLLFVTVLFVVLALTKTFVFWHGLLMLATLVGFVYFNYKNSKKTDVCEEACSPLAAKNWAVVIVITLAGLAAIMYGADLLVKGAVEVARILGVSEEIIGLTIVAVGTSLPELATTVVAALRKQNGVALGNIVGSNIWNIVFIMGMTSTIVDVEVPEQFLKYDMWVMLFATLLLWPTMLSKNKLSRLEGVMFFLMYVAYIVSQILIAKGMWVL